MVGFVGLGFIIFGACLCKVNGVFVDAVGVGSSFMFLFRLLFLMMAMMAVVSCSLVFPVVVFSVIFWIDVLGVVLWWWWMFWISVLCSWLSLALAVLFVVCLEVLAFYINKFIS